MTNLNIFNTFFKEAVGPAVEVYEPNLDLGSIPCQCNAPARAGLVFSLYRTVEKIYITHLAQCLEPKKHPVK